MVSAAICGNIGTICRGEPAAVSGQDCTTSPVVAVLRLWALEPAPVRAVVRQPARLSPVPGPAAESGAAAYRPSPSAAAASVDPSGSGLHAHATRCAYG